MAKEMDATFVNILNVIKNAIDNIVEAHDRADEAKDAAEDAGHLLKQAVELLKLRREYEGSSNIMSYIESMEDSITNLKSNIIQIKKGR